MTGDVLLVDDNVINVHVLAEILKGAGLRARGATSGARALQAIKAQRPDLVLLDVEMPGMDGYEVCRTLKADPATADIPVVFISAHDDPALKTKAYRAGGADYVGKPFEADEVLARVVPHIELARLRHENAALAAERDTLAAELAAARRQEA